MAVMLGTICRVCFFFHPVISNAFLQFFEELICIVLILELDRDESSPTSFSLRTVWPMVALYFIVKRHVLTYRVNIESG